MLEALEGIIMLPVALIERPKTTIATLLVAAGLIFWVHRTNCNAEPEPPPAEVHKAELKGATRQLIHSALDVAIDKASEKLKGGE